MTCPEWKSIGQMTWDELDACENQTWLDSIPWDAVLANPFFWIAVLAVSVVYHNATK